MADDGVLGKGTKILDLLERAQKLGLIGFIIAGAIGYVHYDGQKTSRKQLEKATARADALFDRCEKFSKEQHSKTRELVKQQAVAPPDAAAPAPAPVDEEAVGATEPAEVVPAAPKVAAKARKPRSMVASKAPPQPKLAPPPKAPR